MRSSDLRLMPTRVGSPGCSRRHLRYLCRTGQENDLSHVHEAACAPSRLGATRDASLRIDGLDQKSIRPHGLATLILARKRSGRVDLFLARLKVGKPSCMTYSERDERASIASGLALPAIDKLRINE